MADNFLARLISRKQGQKRTAALHNFLNEDVARYVPPNLREPLGFVAQMNPVNDIYQAGGDLRDGDYIGAATNTAAAALPLAGGVAAARYAPGMAQGADGATGAIVDSLLGFVPGRGAAAMDTVIERASQRGPVPDMHIFAGPKAKTADMAALSRAQEMAETGANRDDIWRETGWFTGADGKWRFEIDDSGANYIAGLDDYGFAGDYGDALDHSALEAAYSDIPGIDTRATWAMSPGGSYTPHVDQEHLGLFDQMEEINTQALTEDHMRNLLLHEGQHAIQAREGFRAGATPRFFMSADGMSQEDAFDAYRRQVGEVEARNVESRSDFTPEQRRATPPWQTQDVPDEDQIGRFGGGVQASAITPAQQQAQEVLDLLSQGRASEVTDEMMAAADDLYLFDNYDLPMDEASRMQRAREMGFDTDTPLYHGTGSDVAAFDNAKIGQNFQNGSEYGVGHYFTEHPRIAGGYAERAQSQNEQIVPAYLRGDRADVQFVGHGETTLDGVDVGAVDGVNIRKSRNYRYRSPDNEPGGTIEEASIFDPRNIRSRFARFDPRLSHLRNLSAGVGGMGLLTTQTNAERDERELRNYLLGVQ